MPPESKRLIDLSGKLDFHLRHNSDVKRKNEIIKEMRQILTKIKGWEYFD